MLRIDSNVYIMRVLMIRAEFSLAGQIGIDTDVKCYKRSAINFLRNPLVIRAIRLMAADNPGV